MKKIIMLALVLLLCLMAATTAFAAETNDYVAEVNNIKYTTLIDAVNAAEDGQTIYLLADYEVETEKLTSYILPENGTLDLNGHTLSVPGQTAFFAGKNIKICNGTISLSDSTIAYALIIGNNYTGIEDVVATSAIIEGVTVKNGGINVTTGTDVTLRNDTVVIGSATRYYAVYAASDAKVIIESGTYQGGTKKNNKLDLYETDTDGIVVYGGTFYNSLNSKYCAEGYMVYENANGKYDVIDENSIAIGELLYYTSLQDAANAGETNVTLIANVDESFTIKNNLTLNLGSFTMTGIIGVADYAFTATGTEDHQSCQIDGPTITINNDSSTASVLLAAPRLDHHTFLGWCNGSDPSQPTYASKSGDNWIALAGQTYHAHWQHSNYSELGSALHHNFEMTYAGDEPENYAVTFELTSGTGSILSVEDGNYFSATVDGLKVTLTPKELVKQLDAGTYTEEIHVTTGDGATHTIHAKLIVAKVDSAVSLSADKLEYAYGDTIILTASVRKADSGVMALSLDEPDLDTVAFYCGTTPLGTATVEYMENTFPQQGTATLTYDTAAGTLGLGEYSITAVYGGSINLNSNTSSTITVALGQKTLTIDNLTAVTREYNGEVSITDFEGGDLNGVVGTDHVYIDTIVAAVDDANVGENKPVSISSITLAGDDSKWYTVQIPVGLTVTITPMTISSDSSVTVNGTTITGPATADQNNVYVTEIGKITANGETYTVKGGTVTVDATGTASIPQGSSMTSADGVTVNGPATINTDGTTTLLTGGTVNVNGTEMNVTSGSVTLGTDGSVKVSDGSIVTVNGVTVTGPATVNPDGTVEVATNGTINNGDNNTTITVTGGSANVNDDGSVTVPSGSSATVNGTPVTGPANVDAGGNVTVSTNGSIIVGDATTGTTNVTVTTGPVTVNDNGTVTVPSGSVVIVDGATITGSATVNADGSVTVDSNGKVTVNGTTYTVTSGSVTVNDGKLTIPSGSSVSDGTNTITGPITIDGAGGTQTVPAGGNVNVGGTDVDVTDGNVTVNPDGSVTVPDDSSVEVGGTTIDGPATIDPDDGKVDVEADGSVTVGGNTITGPVTVNPDGSVDIPTGGSAQVGDNTVTGPATVNTDGTVEVETNGTITNTDTNTTVTVTGGSANVNDDGSVVIPSGSSATVNGTPVTGPANVDVDGNVTVGTNGSVTVGDATTGTTNVTVTTGPVTVNDNGTVTVPSGSVVIVDGATITGSATVNADGSVTVDSNGKVTVNGTTYTVTSGSVTVNDGKLTIPSGSSVSDGTNTITGPITIDGAGGTQTVPAGGNVNVGGTDVDVTDGNVTVNPDGSVTVPDDSSVEVGGTTINGPATIDPDDGKVDVEAGGSVTVGGNTITGPVTVNPDGSVDIPTGGSAQVGDTTVTGPATVNPDGAVEVETNGTITNTDTNTTVTVTGGSANVNDDGSVVIPSGSSATVNGTPVTGPANVDVDGNVTVGTNGSVTVGDATTGTTTVTVTTGPVTVNDNGTVTVSSGSSVTVNGVAVTGPATVNADGTVSITSGGSLTNGSETYVVAIGTVIMNTDGTATVPADSAVTVNGQTIPGPAIIDGTGIHYDSSVNVTTNVTATYGDTITLLASISRPETKSRAAVNTVDFYCGTTLLDSVPVTNDTAILSYDTGKGGIPVGTAQEIKVVFGGSANYNASSTTAIVTLLPKNLTIEGLTAVDRIYNGSTTVELTGGTLIGIVGDDDVSVAIPKTGTMADAAVGNGKLVNIGTLTLSGAQADRYTLTQPTVTVNIMGIAVTIVTQPLDQYVVEGQRATFTIGAQGDGLTYQWYINRNNGNGWRKLDGMIGPEYVTSVTDLECDGFQYGCVVTDMYGNSVKSDIAVLHVSAVPVLPETGDNSQPMLYLALLMASLAGMIVLKKRVRA